jgi:hypothetical protein
MTIALGLWQVGLTINFMGFLVGVTVLSSTSCQIDAGFVAADFSRLTTWPFIFPEPNPKCAELLDEIKNQKHSVAKVFGFR